MSNLVHQFDELNMLSDGDSLKNGFVFSTDAIYGYETHKRDGFRCQYCGFDGRCFDGWQQLSIDRIVPGMQGGKYEPENMITACNACNSITSLMEFDASDSREEIIERMKVHVADRRDEFRQFWEENVRPYA